MNKRIAPLALTALLAGCVSVAPPLPKKIVIRPDQRTVLLLYPSPGPWVGQTDTKLDSAAKSIPGLGLMWQGKEDENGLKESLDLQRYLPQWSPEADFLPILQAELKKTGYPGRWLGRDEAAISDALFARFNKSGDILKWRQRYFNPEPGTLSLIRNYSSLIELDDALVFEVNLQFGVNGLGTQVYPALQSVTRLYRAGTMRLLWEHRASSEDPALTKNIYDFKIDPEILKAGLRKLMPGLATQIAAGLRKDIVERSLVLQRKLDALSPGRPPAVVEDAIKTATEDARK